MKVWGYLLLAVGLIGGLAACLMETTVTSSVPTLYGGGTDSSTYNLGLLQRQTLAFAASAIAFLAGAVLIGAGELQETMVERSEGIARLLKRLDPTRMEGTEFAAHEVSPPPMVEPQPDWSAAPTDTPVSWKTLSIIIGGFVIALAILLYVGRAPTSSPAAAAIAANADTVADNLEAEADRMEALADNTVNRP